MEAVWILISWLLDLHCFQLSLYLISYYMIVKKFVFDYQPGFSICALSALLRQAKFSLDTYIYYMAIYLCHLSLTSVSIKLCSFHSPALDKGVQLKIIKNKFSYFSTERYIVGT